MKVAATITFFLIAVIFVTLTGAVDATTTTTTAASCSYADVSAAVGVAARGSTVTVPAGSATWTTTLSLTRGIHLEGAGRDSTIITRAGVAIQIAPDATAISNEETISVTGFTFNGNSQALNFISVTGAGAGGTKPFKNLVIGNNRFRKALNQDSGGGVIVNYGQTRGVIYGNIFEDCDVILKILGNDSTNEWASGNFPFAFGNSDNLFFENNTIQWTTSASWGSPGWTEIGQCGRIVQRYNTWNFANVIGTGYEMWDNHGFQYWPGGQTGTMISEYYGNTILNFAGYRNAYFRGSWGLMFNNIITGPGGGGISMGEYPGGLTANVPGASGHYICEINNTYTFNNTLRGSEIVPTWSAGCCPQVTAAHIFENANWWRYNPSFNGSTGIGRGTSAPTGSCTRGVGYWQCSSPGATTNPAIVQTGVFWKATATNTWTAYYRPYLYPHPLTNGNPPPTPTPTPVPTPTPTPTILGLSFDASEGNITLPFAIAANTISQNIQTSDPTQGGRASYTFAVPTAGDYAISASVNCPDDASNSFFVNIDAEPSSAMIWNISVTSGPGTRVVAWAPDTTSKVWTLSAGNHQLFIRGREANAVLQHINLVAAPNPPEGLIVAP